MYIQVLKSKIHRVRVTQANLNYVGSITIDRTLMDAVGILPGERVQVVDCNNGNRLDTYVIAGEPDSGVICLNGPAARLVQPDDIVIIMSYALMDYDEARTFQPKIIFPDSDTKRL